MAPGAAADYDFPLAFPGTFWMHSHQGMQEQRLMAAPLIIRDGGLGDAQEIVMMLHDFAFAGPEEIMAGLRKGRPGGAMKMGGMPGMKMPDMKMPDMAGMAMDLNDVAYDAFLANDPTLADPEVLRVEPGGRILLRIINGGSGSNFIVDLGPLQGDLVAVDGHPVPPA